MISFSLTAKMTAQIVMTPDYPAVAPLFLVSLQWQTERTGLNDVNIQVNFFFEKWLYGNICTTDQSS